MTYKSNPALLPEALYSKSQVYIKRALRAKEAGDLEEYQLWASLALELLGKATLAHVHPALVADPNHAPSLFAACNRPISADIKTITAKTLFERLGHIAKDFDTRLQKFCDQMALRRNSELHSGESPFSGMQPDVWEKGFWHAVQVLLSAQERTLEVWLGAEDALAPKAIIADAVRAIEFAVSSRIDKTKEDFVRNNPDPRRREQTVKDSEKLKFWQYNDQLDQSIDGYEPAECPACGSRAMLAGVLIYEEAIDECNPEDPMTELVEQVYSVEEFFCPTCGLHLRGKQEIEAAGLPDEFMETQTREREFEPEYGND
jgi:hypothetical protein